MSSSHRAVAQDKRFRAHFRYTGFVLAITTAGPAFAQQTIGSSASAVDLPEITVTTTGVPTPVAEVANTVTVLTSQQIEREQRRTVPDLLRQVPGLNVVQNGGPGGVTSVFLRGTNSNHVKVLIDGIDVSDPSNVSRTFDFGQLLTGDIDRIEVLRGPQSGFYGADAIGGVISVTTKRGEGPPKITLQTEAGSFGTFNQNVGLSGSQGNIYYAFAVQHFRSEETPVTPQALVLPGRRNNPNFYDNLTYSTKLGVDVNDVLGFNYVGRYTDSRLLYTGDGGFPSAPNAFRSIQTDHHFYTRVETVVRLLDGRFKNTFGYAFADIASRNQSPPSIFGLPAPTWNTGYRNTFDWRGDLAIMEGQTLITGVQRDIEQLETATLRARNGNTGVYAELQSQFAKRFFLVSNVRYDENDSFGSAVTYRIAPAFIVPGSETKLKASIGTGFKAPSLNQLFVDFRPSFNFFGNPNLRPERSTGYEIGFEQPLLEDRFRFGALYFQNDIRDLINTNALFTSYTNVGRAKTSGSEAFASMKWTAEIATRVDYTYTIARDEILRQDLLRRPKNKISATLDWTPLPGLTLSATSVTISGFIDATRDFAVPRFKAPGFTIVNFAARYAVSKDVDVFARVDNLFNERYQNPTGFRGPGIAAYAGLRLTNWSWPDGL